MSRERGAFTLKSSEDFAQRRKNVFDQLATLEPNLQSSRLSPVEETEMETDEPPVAKKSRRCITKQFRGKESIFKRPQDPITKNYMRRMPDFKKNPHKWVKYSLDDVKEEDISDKGNTRAALSFLNELRNRKNLEGEEETVEEEPKKIVFRKRTVVSKGDEEESKASFQSSKVVMPEYVVGQKVRKEKKNKDVKSSGSQQLKLDHLFDEDE